MKTSPVAAPAVLLATLLAIPALAQTGAPAPSRKGVADTVTVLPTVRVDTDRQKLPERSSATTVRMERGKLARFLPLTTGDAMLSAPGVELSKMGPWSSRVSLRGLSGERVLVMVDGVRLQSGRGHGAQTSLVSVDKLETLELQPGAGSAQFGSDALAGVVNLVTHRSLFANTPATTFTMSGRVTEPGGERNEHARLRVTGRNLGAELSGGLGRLDHLSTPDGRYDNSGHHEQDLSGRIAYRLGSATFDAEHSRHAAYDIGLPAFSNDAGARGSYPLQARDLDRLEFSMPRSDGLRPEMKLLAVQQRFRTKFAEKTVTQRFSSTRRPIGTSTVEANDDIVTWSRGLQPSLQRGPVRLYGEWRHETTSGPRHSTTTTRNLAGTITSPPVDSLSESVPNARRSVLGGGAFGSFDAPGALKLELGARYDRLHSRADSTEMSFTPRLDVVDERWSFEVGAARPIGAVTPYVHLGSGFRAPNLEERYFNNSFHGSTRLFGNPDLRAERSLTTEVGVRMADVLGGRIAAARLSAYHSDVNNLISFKYLDQLYGVPRFQYTNVREALLEGLEGQIDARTGVLGWSANVAFPRGQDLRTGEPIADLGASRATVDLRLPAAFLPQGLMSLRARWTDGVQNRDTTIARPAFWTSSAELSATLVGARVTLAVRNLTNTRYREPLSFIPETGRTWSLAVRRDLLVPTRANSRKGS